MSTTLKSTWAERGPAILTGFDITRRGEVELSISETREFVALTEGAAIEGVISEGGRLRDMDNYTRRIREFPFPFASGDPGTAKGVQAFSAFRSGSPFVSFRRELQTSASEDTRQVQSRIVTRSTETQINAIGDWKTELTPDGETTFSHDTGAKTYPFDLTVTLPVAVDFVDGEVDEYKRYTRAVLVRRDLFGPDGVTGAAPSEIVLEGGELGADVADNMQINITHPSIIVVMFASWLVWTEPDPGETVTQWTDLTHQEMILKVYS